MNAAYKLLLMLGFFTGAVLLGLKTYVFLNNKINNSRTVLELVGFSLLLFIFLAALFAGTISCFVWVFVTLSTIPEG